MLHTIHQKIDNLFSPGDTLFIKYEGEDDRDYLVSSRSGRRVSVPKKRSVPAPFIDPAAQPLIACWFWLLWAWRRPGS